VWEIAQMADDFGSVERLIGGTHLTEAQVRSALAYRAQFKDEIDEAIEENRRPVEELRSLYPFVRFTETSR
jgi:hypothetical protein